MADQDIKYSYCSRKDCQHYKDLTQMWNFIWFGCLKCIEFDGINLYQRKDENNAKISCGADPESLLQIAIRNPVY